MNGKQGGNSTKLAQALLTIAPDQEQPPFRFTAGADAITQAEEKLAERQQQIDAAVAWKTSSAAGPSTMGAGAAYDGAGG